MNMEKLSFSLILAVLACFSGCKSQLTDSAPKINNGEEVVSKTDEIARVVVSLMPRNNAQCTGMLIQRGVILTAAHCLLGDPIMVVFDIANYNMGQENVLTIKRNQYIAHPDFADETKDFDKKDYDIGLAFFDPDLLKADVFSRYRVGTLVSTDEELKGYMQKSVKIAGYGFNNTPEWGDSGVLVTGTSFFSEVSVKSKGSRMKMEKKLQNKASVRQGDSGGPVYVENEDGGISFLGINVMGGDIDGLPEGITVANTIPGYLDWINNTLSERNLSLPEE